jgi:hypothetical protein
MKKIVVSLFLLVVLLAPPVYAAHKGEDLSKSKHCTALIQAKNVSGVDVIKITSRCGEVYILYMLDGKYIPAAQALDIINAKKADI